jgi:hypothetical protein
MTAEVKAARLLSKTAESDRVLGVTRKKVRKSGRLHQKMHCTFRTHTHTQTRTFTHTGRTCEVRGKKASTALHNKMYACRLKQQAFN